MRNRAKCKLCNSIIESFHSEDIQLCSCGAISVSGGNALKCQAKDWENFIRVDDEGNEIVVKVQEKHDDGQFQKKPSREELIEVLESTRKNIDSLPTHAAFSPVSNADFSAFLSVLVEILRSA